MDNRFRQSQHRCPNLPPNEYFDAFDTLEPAIPCNTNTPPRCRRPDSFFGTDYPPSSIRNGSSVSDSFFHSDIPPSCIRNSPSVSDSFFHSDIPSSPIQNGPSVSDPFFDTNPPSSIRNCPSDRSNRASPRTEMNYYGGSPGLNRARNYNMVNDYYRNRNENGPFNVQQPPIREPYYREYPMQYYENYFEQSGYYPPTMQRAQTIFYGTDTWIPPPGIQPPTFPRTQMLPQLNDDTSVFDCDGCDDEYYEQMCNTPNCCSRKPVTPIDLNRGNKNDEALATNLINEFLVVSSVPCGKDGPCLVSALSKESIGAGLSQVHPASDSTSAVASKESSEKSQNSQPGKATKKSKIPKKTKTPGTPKGNKKGKGGKKSKKSPSGPRAPKADKTKKEEEKKLEDTKQDSINMLSVTISTVMLLAADIKTIPDNYISWTYKYLKCIKNCQGQHPANIKKILKMLHVDETIDSISGKNSVRRPSILKVPNSNSNNNLQVNIVEPNKN